MARRSSRIASEARIGRSHPLTVRTFDEVSAVRKELGGIVYIANVDGLWILKQNEALDKSLDVEYRNYVLYGSR